MHFSGRRPAILLLLAAHARSVATLNVNNGRHFVFCDEAMRNKLGIQRNSAPISRHYLQLRQNSNLIIRQNH